MKSSDIAKSIASKLSALAKKQGCTYQSIATVFLIERLLIRLVSHPALMKSLVFKGGYVGLRVYDSSRFTVDLDALLVNANKENILQTTIEIAQSDIGDGTWFDFEKQIELKTQGEYGGSRQVFRAGIGNKPKNIKISQIIHLDIGIGDPVTPAPFKASTHELIGIGEVSWNVYPIETIVAEKLQTLMVRGGDNSRSKDVFDLYYYLPKSNTKKLKKAIDNCFAFRGSPIPKDFSELLSAMNFTLLRRGWKSATDSLEAAPTFDEAISFIIDELKKLNYMNVNQKWIK